MDVWVVHGFMGQIYGAFTTERKARIRQAHLKRDGVPSDIHLTRLNWDGDHEIEDNEA